jgi:5-oxopent-3-ene-1,2,5-tricarboxylate decarboxylase/2-hydroxyhepta-2,4-diene-1,7-dioate isomerase
VPRSAVPDPDALAITVEVDGELVQRASTSGLIRPIAKLLADVTEFMTLARGDLLLIGVPEGAPRLRAGQRATIRIDGLGELHNHVVAE